MHKNKNIVIGVILILLAIVLYGLLHDISKLAIFSFIPQQTESIIFYKKIQMHFYIKVSKYGMYKLVKNYMIDVLWYTSFCLIVFEIEERRIKYAVVFLLGMVSESLQFFIEGLGTFDFIDLLLYGVVLLIFYITECKKLLILESLMQGAKSNKT